MLKTRHECHSRRAILITSRQIFAAAVFRLWTRSDAHPLRAADARETASCRRAADAGRWASSVYTLERPSVTYFAAPSCLSTSS